MANLQKRYYLIHAFCDQRLNAIKNGKGFELTFEQWLKIWTDSGHLADRGRLRDQYCMARYGDKGPYALGNVKIVTNRENRAEENCGPETRQKMAAAKLGKKQSPELIEKRIAPRRGRKDPEDVRLRKSECKIGSKNPMFGREITEEHRQKLIESRLGKIFITDGSITRRVDAEYPIQEGWWRGMAKRVN